MSLQQSDSESESVEEELKVVILGEPSVGKTSIVTRYCSNSFSKQYYPTSGIDFFLKRLVLQRDKNVTLKIWDIGGTSHNGNMIDKYIYGVNIILLVYDVTNDTSFNCIPSWIELVKEVIKLQDVQPKMVLIGNKCDLEHQRSVKIEKHQKFSNDYNLSSHIVSARTGECVSLAFQKTAAEYLGIKLTRSEVQEYQPIVRAEISTYSNLPIQPLRNTVAHSRSSMASSSTMTPNDEDELTLPRASINKMIKEILPNIRVANESRELILNCCTEFIHLLSSEANDICNSQQKKTINSEHILAALDRLGFGDYIADADAVLQDCKAVAAQRRRQSTRLENLGIPEEELLRQQQELFARAREEQAAIEQQQWQQIQSSSQAPSIDDEDDYS